MKTINIELQNSRGRLINRITCWGMTHCHVVVGIFLFIVGFFFSFGIFGSFTMLPFSSISDSFLFIQWNLCKIQSAICVQRFNRRLKLDLTKIQSVNSITAGEFMHWIWKNMNVNKYAWKRYENVWLVDENILRTLLLGRKCFENYSKKEFRAISHLLKYHYLLTK